MINESGEKEKKVLCKFIGSKGWKVKIVADFITMKDQRSLIRAIKKEIRNLHALTRRMNRLKERENERS